MQKIPTSNDNRRNTRGSSSLPCIVCGREVSSKSAKWVRVWYGSDAVTAEEAAALEITNPAGDTGCYPIGSCCLRNYPEMKPYAYAGEKEG